MLAINTANIVLEYPDVFFIYTPVLKDGLINLIFSEEINKRQALCLKIYGEQRYLFCCFFLSDILASRDFFISDKYTGR